MPAILSANWMVQAAGLWKVSNGEDFGVGKGKNVIYNRWDDSDLEV